MNRMNQKSFCSVSLMQRYKEYGAPAKTFSERPDYYIKQPWTTVFIA